MGTVTQAFHEGVIALRRATTPDRLVSVTSSATIQSNATHIDAIVPGKTAARACLTFGVHQLMASSIFLQVDNLFVFKIGIPICQEWKAVELSMPESFIRSPAMEARCQVSITLAL